VGYSIGFIAADLKCGPWRKAAEMGTANVYDTWKSY